MATATQKIPRGYKQTEIGVIPEDWGTLPLSQITSEIGDGIHATPIYSTNGEYFFINGNNIYHGRIVIAEDTKTVNISEFKKYKKELGSRTILLSINGTIGNLAFFNCEKVILGKSAAYLNIENNIEKQYIYYALKTQQTIHQFNNGLTGTTIKNLGLLTIRNTKILLPPTKSEQTAIATVLSDTDALIENIEKLIAKKKAIKQGAMQQLLTGKKRLPGFSGEWEVKKLGEVAVFYKGKGLPKSEITTNGKCKCIHYGELFTIYHEEIKKIFSYTNKEDNFFLSHANDVLMPTSDVTPNGLATSSCVKENDVILGGDVLVIRSFKGVIDGVFISYGIRQDKKQIMQLVSGSTVYHLYGSDMKKYEFNIPPTIEEQAAVVTILSDMDAEIESLEQKRDKYTMLKQGMMQELLIGKIRLK